MKMLNVLDFYSVDINDINVVLDTSSNEVKWIGNREECISMYNIMIDSYPYLIVLSVPSTENSIEVLDNIFKDNSFVTRMLPYLNETESTDGVDFFTLDLEYFINSVECWRD